MRFHRIYHYRPDKRPRDLDTLIARRLYSSKIDALNDPFEFSSLRSLTDHPDLANNHRDSGVTCFCRSLTNPLLWSHYAARHTGFAIGINPVHPHFGGNKGLGGRFLLDVRYEDVAPTYDRFGDGLALAAVLTKPTCWAYEQEVRLIRQTGNEFVDIPSEMIVEIVFGARMEPARITDIIAAVEGAGLAPEFTRMQMLDEGFGVKPVSISRP